MSAESTRVCLLTALGKPLIECYVEIKKVSGGVPYFRGYGEPWRGVQLTSGEQVSVQGPERGQTVRTDRRPSKFNCGIIVPSELNIRQTISRTNSTQFIPRIWDATE